MLKKSKMGLQCVTTMVSTGQYSHTNIIHPPPEDQWATSYTGTSGNQGCGQSFMVGGSYAGMVWAGCPSKPLPSIGVWSRNPTVSPGDK